MSFFQWLREGVRQAVVLGLADAVEDVGSRCGPSRPSCNTAADPREASGDWGGRLKACGTKPP